MTFWNLFMSVRKVRLDWYSSRNLSPLTRHADRRLSRGFRTVAAERGADHALPADDRRLDLLSRPHDGQQRHHAAERKIDVVDRRSRRMEHAAQHHGEFGQVRLEPRKIDGAKPLQEAVFP